MAMYRSLAMNAATATPLDSNVRTWLRLEGIAGFVTGVLIFGRLGGEWLWLIPALLLVDISMVGYLRGPRLGAFVYNLAHQWATGLAVLGAGLAAGSPVLALAGAVLVAHVGMDRVAGYGLKLPTDFRDTHLGRLGAK